MNMAVWALRTRVWDYFVEPIASEEFMGAVHKLLDIQSTNSKQPFAPSANRFFNVLWLKFRLASYGEVGWRTN